MKALVISIFAVLIIWLCGMPYLIDYPKPAPKALNIYYVLPQGMNTFFINNELERNSKLK